MYRGTSSSTRPKVVRTRDEDLFANFSSVCESNNHLWSKRCSWNFDQAQMAETKALRINLQAVQTMPSKSRVSIKPPAYLATNTDLSPPFSKASAPFKFPDYQNAHEVDHRHSQCFMFPPTPPSTHELPSPPSVLALGDSAAAEQKTAASTEPASAPFASERSSWVPRIRSPRDTEFFSFEVPRSSALLPPKTKHELSHEPELQLNLDPLLPPARNNRSFRTLNCRALSTLNTNQLPDLCEHEPFYSAQDFDHRGAQTLSPGGKPSKRMSMRMRVRPVNEKFTVPLLSMDSSPCDFNNDWLSEIAPISPPPCLKQSRRPVKTTLTSTKNQSHVVRKDTK